LPGCYAYCGGGTPQDAAYCAVTQGCTSPHQQCICTQLENNKFTANITTKDLSNFFPSCYDYCNSDRRCAPNDIQCFITCACAGAFQNCDAARGCKIAQPFAMQQLT